jgi:hypothetical protein
MMGGIVIPHYESFSKTTIDSKKNLSIMNRRASDFRFVVNRGTLVPDFSTVPFLNTAQIQLYIERNNQHSKIINTGISLSRLNSEETNFVTSFFVDLPQGIYQARFAIPSAVPENPTVNSAYFTLAVTGQ